MVQFTKPLNYLIGYPYGCVEQTTSPGFPADLLCGLGQEHEVQRCPGQESCFPTFRKPSGNSIDAVIQWRTGVLAGRDNESWWVRCMPCTSCVEARKAGYDVNGEVIRKGLAYIAMKTKSHTIEKDYAYDNGSGQTLVRNIYAKENFYGLFVLAAFGKADLASMNYFKSNISMLALDSRYLLAASLFGSRRPY